MYTITFCAAEVKYITKYISDNFSPYERGIFKNLGN